MYGWTNLISICRTIQDQRDDQLAFGLTITSDVAFVGVNIGHKYGGYSEECVSADTACVGGRDVDQLTGRFAAEWA